MLVTEAPHSHKQQQNTHRSLQTDQLPPKNLQSFDMFWRGRVAVSPASPRSLLGGDLSVVKRAYVPHTCLLGSAFASTAAPRAHNVVLGAKKSPE